jgi:hypothetical protein
MKRLFILSFFLSVLTQSAQVSYLNDTTEISNLSEKVTKTLFRKLFPEAIDEMKKYWPVKKEELEEPCTLR